MVDCGISSTYKCLQLWLELLSSFELSIYLVSSSLCNTSSTHNSSSEQLYEKVGCPRPLVDEALATHDERRPWKAAALGDASNDSREIIDEAPV